MVDAVGVVPEDTEIFRSRVQLGKTVHSLVRVCDALGVGVFGYAPDSLDGRVCAYQLLNDIHIRACGSHGYIDHLNAEVLCDLEVAVIARDRT